MNTDTGKVYTTPEEIEAAQTRGERLVPIAEAAAARIKEGRRLLAKKCRHERSVARRRKLKALAKASRKRNRRA